jgi:hypothetical protein
MADRRPIQQAHERAYVDYFLSWFNHTYHCKFKVVSEPNPPEAIISSSRTTRWIEVSTAFWNKAYAQDLYSHATPDEKHMPVGPGPFQDMDREFAQNFVSVVKKKLEKKSYLMWRDLLGRGYLLIPIMHPWFDGHTVKLMRDAWEVCSINNLDCFRSIYIAFHSLNKIRFTRWPNK